MRSALNSLAIDGTVVIGEGERDEAPMLYIGERVGAGGPKIDIALDPLEGTTITAKGAPERAGSHRDGGSGRIPQRPRHLHGQDRDRAGPARSTGRSRCRAGGESEAARQGQTDGDRGPGGLHSRPAAAQRADRAGSRDRRAHHADLRRRCFRRHLDRAADSGVDIYIGAGGAPEGVLAAAALRCIGGQMQGRLLFRNDDEKGRARRLGITDFNRKYSMQELAKGDVMFAATGVTDGTMLRGVRRGADIVTTHSMVMRSKSGTVRVVEAQHNWKIKQNL